MLIDYRICALDILINQSINQTVTVIVPANVWVWVCVSVCVQLTSVCQRSSTLRSRLKLSVELQDTAVSTVCLPKYLLRISLSAGFCFAFMLAISERYTD